MKIIQQALAKHGQIYVSELLSAPFRLDADHINKAIADKLLVTNLDTEPLTQPQRCRLFRDATLMEFVQTDLSAKVPLQERFYLQLQTGSVLSYQGQALTINLLGDKEVICASEDGSTKQLSLSWIEKALKEEQLQLVSHPTPTSVALSQYTQRELQAALSKQQQFDKDTPNVCDRTLRRYKQRQLEASANGGSPLLALIPQTKNRGNRTSRMSEEQSTALEMIYRTHWVTNSAKNYKSCYRELLVYCDDKGITPPSYPTLINYLKAETDNRDVRTRHGKRMAYQESTFVEVLNADTPQHGARPFQYLHIDHTQLDIELIDSSTGNPLGRPWLTFALDAFCRRVLAFYLTYDPPSYTSVMMCIRTLVQRHGRLPEFIVVDNGKDLTSSAFTTFLTAMGVHLRLRPAGQPRHGAVLERLFGTLHSTYILNLAGNTKATKNVRMTTGKHLPVNFAEWTLESMFHGLAHWAYDFYDQEVHRTLDMSPRKAFEQGLALSGKREQRIVLFNKDFLIATCPPADRTGERKVHGQRGVKVNDLLYWHPCFSAPDIAGHSFPVRYDPWDASSVYVLIKSQWVHAQCRNLLVLGHITEAERQALSDEYRNRQGCKVDDSTRMQRLKEFMQTFTPEGAMATVMARSAENKLLYNKLQIANVSPVTPPAKPGVITSTSITAHSTNPTHTKEPVHRPPKKVRSKTLYAKPSDASIAPQDCDFNDLFDTF